MLHANAIGDRLQMAEVIAVRTFMKLKVLDAIPKEGSISLEDLSKATGVQDSLLGMHSGPLHYRRN